MITLQSQADKIANLLKEPDNHELKERIKESFKNLIAEAIRQSYEKNGIDEAFLLPFEAELIDAVYPETRFADMKSNIKRSKHRIPTPVRFKSSAPYVSVYDHVNVYTYIHQQELRHHPSYLSLGMNYVYFVQNNYIYIKCIDPTSKIKTKSIHILSPYENPEEVLGYYDMESDWQDIVIPFSRDIIGAITTRLLKEEFGVIAQPENINVELNERPE